MTPEGEIEAYLKKRVKAAGGEYRKLRWIGRNGAPDRLVWFAPSGLLDETRANLASPNFCFVEVKRPGKTTADPHQEREHKRLRDAAFPVAIVDTKSAVDALINRLTGQIESA